MAEPIISKTIGVKVATANVGEFVIVRNLTRGRQLTGALKGTDRGAVFNVAKEFSWKEGDLIQASISGSVSGFTQATIDKGGVQLKIIATADTTTPGVSL